MVTKVISYLRVSGDRSQTATGLGIESQRQAVGDYIATTGAKLVEEVVGIESGKKADRPQLAAARRTGAVLRVARLCRLSRDAHFLLGVEAAASSSSPAICLRPTDAPCR